jgi:outer membrane murein-binding lipoprotein Lpp
MARVRILLVASALAGALLLAGCASAFRTSKPELPPFRDASMSLQAASDAVTLGKTTKAEALATLGPATVVKFDSGFEVWVYRSNPTDRARSPAAEVAPAEFVILFAPNGIVSKTRIRPQ